jgi:transcriptional regulator
MTSHFETYAPRDVADLIAEYPLAWVTARGGGAEAAALMPLLTELDGEGNIVRLIGHMGRNIPLRHALAVDPRALILFQGPQGYVSPNMAGLRDWAPTWNFIQVRIEAELIFQPERTTAAIEQLVEVMEADQPAPWRIEELGARAESLKSRIIAFTATPTQVRGYFKLGQDESVEVLRSILETTEPALARWTRRLNAGRV